MMAMPTFWARSGLFEYIRRVEILVDPINIQVEIHSKGHIKIVLMCETGIEYIKYK